VERPVEGIIASAHLDTLRGGAALVAAFRHVRLMLILNTDEFPGLKSHIRQSQPSFCLHLYLPENSTPLVARPHDYQPGCRFCQDTPTFMRLPWWDSAIGNGGIRFDVES
jgi:hypothetical protein